MGLFVCSGAGVCLWSKRRLIKVGAHEEARRDAKGRSTFARSYLQTGSEGPLYFIGREILVGER